MIRKILGWWILGTTLVVAQPSRAEDWPQLQHDSYRTGRTSDSVAWPIRPRWVWFGPNQTVRNHRSNAAWTGPDLRSNRLDGYSSILADKGVLPASVPMTFSEGMQPIVAAGKVFAADQEGKIYAIKADDGSTSWSADNPGGAIAAGAYAGGVVAFASMSGALRGFNADSGALVWDIQTKGPITSAPVTNGTLVCAGSNEGRVYCIQAQTGALAWKSDELGAPISGGLAMDETSVYVGVENLTVVALNLSNGGIRKTVQVAGESFYFLWPVIQQGLVFLNAYPIPCHGAEAVMCELQAASLAQQISMETEQQWIEDWFLGNTHSGAFPDASPDWRHLTVLTTADLTEPFKVASGIYEGCGAAPEAPVVDNLGRVLTYWRTSYPTFVAPKFGFGCGGGDIGPIDLTNGKRQIIDNGRFCSETQWFPWEADNLHAMTVGGTILYLKQYWRGVLGLDLSNSEGRHISQQYHVIDGSGWDADVLYAGDRGAGSLVPTTPTPDTSGRVGPAISGNLLVTQEPFCITAMETDQ